MAHFLESPTTIEQSPLWGFQPETWNAAWSRCWPRIRSWPIPPRWSPRDWWETASDLEVEPIGDGNDRLLVRHLGGATNTGILSYSVQVKPGQAVPEGEYELRVRPSSSATDDLIIPLRIRREEL